MKKYNFDGACALCETGKWKAFRVYPAFGAVREFSSEAEAWDYADEMWLEWLRYEEERGL